MLDCGIQREMDVAARRNVQTLDTLDEDASTKRVALSHRRSGFAADKIVVLELDAFQPFRITPAKADQLAGQLTLRVVAFGFVKHADALGIERLYFFGLHGRNLPSDPDKRLRGGNFFLDVSGAQVENLCQSLTQFIRIMNPV